MPTLAATERALFMLTIAMGASLMWLAPRLPMVDLPQHAAQVALWRDLLQGSSPWSDLVGLNLLTPYLVAYGVMLPLSFILPMTIVAKLVLTAAWFAFVAASIALRKAVGGDPRLDWLGPIGFFGYAWQWGFLTFIAASPLGLVFLVLAHRHAHTPTWRRGAGLVLVGIVCFFAHGLIFLMAAALGGLLALRGLWLRRSAALLPTVLPYAVVGMALVGFRLATRDDSAAFHYDGFVYGLPLWLRPITMLGYLTDVDANGPPFPRPAIALLLLAPLLLRLPRNREGGTWLFGGMAALLLGLPFYAFETAGLGNRFALFLLPCFALLFGRGTDVAVARTSLAGVVLIATCWLTLGVAGFKIAAFGTESQSFETVLGAAQPGHRALALIYDRASPAADNPDVYMHYAAWYGAEKHGFVDFNFAAFPPQVVRFRPDHRSIVTSKIGWLPGRFDWASPAARLYDYVFVRGPDQTIAAIRAASPCVLSIVAQDGPWVLMQRGACPAG